MMRAVASAALLVASALLLASAAVADESQVQLRDGDGKDLVVANCAICHSLDYIRMNAPFLEPAGWDTEVAKMINVFGAPIAAADAAVIADYLKANYGKAGR